MLELKVCQFGDSLGVILPEEAISRLHTADGERLYLIEAPDGGYRLTRSNSAFEEKMAKADELMDRYKNTLHVLSK